MQATKTLLLTRQEHDAILDNDPVLLKRLFTHYWDWTIGGIRFRHVSESDRAKVGAVIKRSV